MKDGNYVVGQMKPSTEGRSDNAELQRMCPPNVTFTHVTLGIRDLVESQITAALSRIEEAAKELTSRNVDVITMGGTPPVVFGGYGFDKKIIERIGKVTPIPATTGHTSSVEALRLFGAGKMVIVTPYKDVTNQMVIKFMEASGFEVGCLKSAKAPFEDYPKLPRSLSYDLSLQAVKESPDAKCIFIPCSAWPVTDNIEQIEKETGIPVVAGTQSGIWGALRLIGIKTPIYGYGKLLREL